MLFVHCRAHWCLRANISCRIKRSSGCYHPRRYRLQLLRTATAGCACTPRNARSYKCALVWILTFFFFNLRVFIINRNRFWEKCFRWHNPSLSRRGVTVTVESKQQIWTKHSLHRRYLCLGCQLNSDQALRSFCLKGQVRVRGSKLWRHRWQEATEFFCTKTRLFWRELSNQKDGQKPRKCSLRQEEMKAKQC